jgi:hypothetical protein
LCPKPFALIISIMALCSILSNAFSKSNLSMMSSFLD